MRVGYEEFRGAAGLDALSARSGPIFAAAEPDSFRARLEILLLAKTRIMSLRATPLRAVWEPSPGPSANTVLLMMTMEGTVVGHHDGRAFTERPGSVLLMRTSAPYNYATSAPTHSVMLQLDLALVHSSAVASLRRVTSIDLGGHPAAQGIASVVGTMLERPPAADDAAVLERILLDQVDSLVLREADARTARGGPDDGELYLAYRDRFARGGYRAESVGPAALGVTAARLRRALLAYGTTPATLQRELRLDALADRLRDPDEGASLNTLVAELGFGSHAQAARQFRDRFGMSMRAYRTMIRFR